MLLALAMPVFAGVLINEVMYDPSGSDDGLEWIELCNNGTDTVDLTGYQIQSAGSSWTESYTFASGTIAPGGYLLVGAGSATNAGSFDPNLQNGGGGSDGVRLVDASSTAVDTVIYDGPNTTLAEDEGTVPATGAPAASSDKSIGRWPDCTDTNVSATDFSLYTTSSALAANVDPNPTTGDDTGVVDTGTSGTTADCTGSDGVVINELMPDPDGSDSGLEWLELKNNGAADVVLDGWTILYDTSSFDGASSYTFPAGTTLAAGGYVAVGAGGLTATLNLGNAGSSADGVRLTCNDAAVDTVIYGDSNTDNFPDDSGAVATSLAPAPSSGDSLQRIPDGVDTDQCGVDFVSGASSEGAENTTDVIPTGDADCTGNEGVTINEFVYATDQEWVELYNSGATSVVLDSWLLEFGTSSYSKDVTLPAGTTLAPGAYVVVGSPGAAVKDVELDMDLGNASDSDGLRLTCNGTPIDTVIYGSPNDNGWADDSGSAATSLGPEADDGQSVARVQDGYDTDQSGVDFTTSDTPTPGSANPIVEPAICDATNSADLKLNEFVYNPDGTDGDHEWVELYNTGSATISLDLFTVETATSSWGTDFTFPGGTDLGPGEFIVVGGSAVPEADFVSDALSLGNGTSSADGVRVVDCEGTVLDSALYGGDPTDPITGDNGSLEVIPDAGDGNSLGRYPDGVDTDGLIDWHPYSPPTPGAPNADPGASTGPGAGGKVGCGSDSPPSSAPGGCNTVLPLGGLEVGLALVALLRRRA